ncbi:ATP-binding protein [Actinoplanes sp. NPDC048796]|uniref:HD domain-containing protein n=1 Tax=Actinoplanes sp. NPDC048796 TaxID=3155640 RepID=UPI0033C3A4C8
MTEWGPLGEVLAKASDRNRANVADLVGRARELLKLVRDTFPRYTLHDEQHAENVVALMGRLAAPRLDVMDPLEAALLILAAYFHDAGMAYTYDERARIVGSAEFKAFLATNDSAYLATRHASGGEPPEWVVELYLRSRHADRVWVHLESCDPSWLRWDNGSIIEPLAAICVSHNEPTSALREERFRSNFRQKADLRFCAVILRLADILDLDHTRAPQVVYDYLGLGRRDSATVAASDDEWRKHLAAGGFEFPPDPRRDYALQFVADPSDPGVEHDLRTFLGVIQNEMLRCRAVADLCAERWRGLPLPIEVDTSTITSHGYTYGEFRFELDRRAVLELFTGDRLYGDSYVFLQELLQNALDAVRARAHLFGHVSAGIEVRCWEDSGGHVWVRVDDDGIGMDEEALRRYFLRVGQSYYRSAEFEADIARRGLADRPFGVIGRFGIGVLACFMVGDQVELASMRQTSTGYRRAIRLSINRRDDYFVLQEKGRRGTPMPGSAGPEPAFLEESGTHIAVRIDPNRAAVDLSTMLAKVRSFVFDPPVPVSCNGEPIAALTASLITQPLLEAPKPVKLNLADLNDYSGSDLLREGTLEIVAVPVDLTSTVLDLGVRGQLMAYVILETEGEVIPGLADRDAALAAAFNESLLYAGTSFGELDVTQRREPTVLFLRLLRPDRVEELLRGIKKLGFTIRNSKGILPNFDNLSGMQYWAYSIPFEKLPAYVEASERTKAGWWGYNGIALPTRSNTADVTLQPSDPLILGAISLSGELRPDLSVSRTEVRAIPFPVHSAIQLAVRRGFRAATGDAEWAAAANEVIGRSHLLDLRPAEPCTTATLWRDRLLREEVWNAEQVINTPDGYVSVDRLREAAAAGERPLVEANAPAPWDGSDLTDKFKFLDFLAAGLLHHFVDLMVEPGENKVEVRVTSSRSPERASGHQHLPPLFALPYEGDDSLARAGRHLNERHPLTQWLLAHTATLAADFPVPFQRVFRLAATNHTSVEDINTALDRIARSRSDIAPPPGAYLRQDDNGWWWSR